MRVVKLGGASLAELAAMGRALARFQGFQVVVHGGGPQATELAKRLQIESRKIAGRRITDAATLDVVLMAVGGLVHNQIVAGLASGGLAVVGVAGPSVLRARRRPPVEIDGETIDFGFVGDIETVDAAFLKSLGDRVPVVPSIAGGEGGALWNVNADTAAARVAVALGAEELIQVTDSGGVRAREDDPASLIARLTAPEARLMLGDKTASGGMRPKLEAAISALEAGVKRVRIVGTSGLEDPGAGTTLHEGA